MRLFSVEEAKAEVTELETEMETLAGNLMNGVDREASLARLNEITPNLEVVKAKVEAAEEDGAGSIAEETGITSETLDAEATVAEVLGVVDVLLSSVVDFYNDSNDDDRAEVAKRVNAVASIGEAADIKPSNGKGSRLSPATVTEIREGFKSAWEADNSVEYSSFIRENGIKANLYTVIQIVKGASYASVEGPVRGTDYDVTETPAEEAAA